MKNEHTIPALLNGVIVEPEKIDPVKHKFIGLFRPAQNPEVLYSQPDKNGRSAEILVCVCGAYFRYAGGITRHWQSGCFDIPQYVDI